MDINIILNSAVLRLVADEILQNILEEINVVKGSKKHNKMSNPCFTIENRDLKVSPGKDRYQGSFFITFYIDDYKTGNANVELLGQVMDRIKGIFNFKPFKLDNYKNYHLVVKDISKAKYDKNIPNQHFIKAEIEYKTVKTA